MVSGIGQSLQLLHIDSGLTIRILLKIVPYINDHNLFKADLQYDFNDMCGFSIGFGKYLFQALLT